MSVVADENKQMLIELMRSIIHDNKLVIPPEVNIEGFISEQCSYFHTKRFEFSNLNEINKKIVELSYNYILSHNNTQNKARVSDKNKLVISKREVFDNNLKIQQNNFKNMIQPKKPEKIDFSDGSKDFPINKNFNKRHCHSDLKLRQTLRNLILNQTTHHSDLLPFGF